MTQEAASSETDSSLLRKYRAGDRRAFDALIRRHHGLVYAVAYARLQNAESAEDMAQEVFLRAFLMQEKLRDGERFAPWVATMARNLSTDWLRRGETRSRLLPMIKLEDEQMAQLPGKGIRQPDEVAEQSEQRALADEAIRKLPPHQRELVLLHFSEGMSRSEIARQLGVNPSTVGRQLDAAIFAMRQNVEVSLKESAPTLKPLPASRTRAVACVASAMLLAPEAKAAILSVAMQSTSPVVTDAVLKVSLFELLQTKILSLFVGGTTAMGSAKTAGIIATVVLAFAGVQVAMHRPAPLPDEWAALMNTPPESISGTMEMGYGDSPPLLLEHDKVYRITYPDDIPNARDTTITFTSDGTLRSLTRTDTSAFMMAAKQVNDFGAYAELSHTEMATLLGVTIFSRTPQGLQITPWTEQRKELAPEFARLTRGYQEGRISLKQYREGYLREVKRLNLGPSNPVHRKFYYDEILKSLLAPTLTPTDLLPYMKGGQPK